MSTADDTFHLSFLLLQSSHGRCSVSFGIWKWVWFLCYIWLIIKLVSFTRLLGRDWLDTGTACTWNIHHQYVNLFHYAKMATNSPEDTNQCLSVYIWKEWAQSVTVGCFIKQLFPGLTRDLSSYKYKRWNITHSMCHKERC